MSDTNTKQLSYPEWCAYNPKDPDYHGADGVVAAELKLLQQRRRDANADNLTGLALSGGGIRSATFSLGVMQALARKGWLKRFDYLSTVSGGGYIGTSLTWLLHKKWDCKPDSEEPIQFGLGNDTFPFKTEPVWSTKEDEAPAASSSSEPIPARIRGSMLRWLRQNGKYLTPGGCHNFAAMLAAVLRSTLVSVLVYLAILILLFMGLDLTGAFENARWCGGFADCGSAPLPLVAAGWGCGLFVFFALIYAVSTSFAGLSAGDDRGTAAENRYDMRRFVECNLGRLLGAIIALAVLGALPLIHETILNNAFKQKIATVFSAISTLAGIASSLGVFAQSSSRKPSKWMPLLVGIAATLLLLGVLLLAYQMAVVHLHGSIYLAIGALALITIGWLTNMNYLSVHRFYRDRLMETFMPDVTKAVVHSGSEPGASPEADHTRIHESHSDAGPYHLINTNIVLVESKRPKFKGRGGDNFILSPLYCGSNATGWRLSRNFMGGGMTLATAMAISGAAVNPNTGCGGNGLTRQPILSMLMGLLNIRLGYWTSNPNPEKQPHLGKTPNFIWPGLWELVMRKNLNEDKRFIQLSDGGHFENLGLYELLRRRLRVIVVCDGGADPDYTFSDLANAIEKARADFGALVHIECTDLQPLITRSEGKTNDGECAEKFAERGHLVADILYADAPPGKLIYLTTTFVKNLSADLYGYRKEHPEFPDEPTSDQFFDEKQFEAYRELGFQLAWRMFEQVQGDLDEVIESIARQQH